MGYTRYTTIPTTDEPLKLYKVEKDGEEIVPQVEAGYITQQAIDLNKPDKVVLTFDTTP